MEREIRVLIVDDEEPFRHLVRDRLARKGLMVRPVDRGEAAVEAVKGEEFDVALVDIRMPGMDGIELLRRLKEEQPSLEVIMITGHASVDTAVEAMKLGAYDYLPKPCQLSELEVLVAKAHDKAQLARQNVLLREELHRRERHDAIIGRSPAVEQVKALIARVAPSSSSVLITGETGTGKELVASAIHRLSARTHRPFIAVNCAAFNENLLENELFGHAKGAYTGAAEHKPGLFEVADGGTLFIDEVGEMSPALQAKLLRVLDKGELHRVGETKLRKVDVRLISATNRDLLAEVRRGTFREDLYYRLDVVAIAVPPLRDRRSDIALLVAYFLEANRPAAGEPKRLSARALDLLQQYDWPGNIRELANVIERAVLLSTGPVVGPEDLTLGPGRSPEARAGPSGEPVTLASLERAHIARILELEGGNRARAAKSLGISLRNFYRKIKKYRLGAGPDEEPG
ncbi:MAG: sigma-54-dependent Fis family transcriptional regulator [Deltaproteobacteria bacterium]|nr:sigma-54-dependent Fis family transcriptional regulator [Deltaproteobacteria bacterium]